MLKIGVLKSEAGIETIISKTQKQLLEKAEMTSTVSYYDTEKELFHALSIGEISFLPFRMASLSTNLPQGVVISALSERFLASYSLVISNKNIDETQMLSLKLNAHVATLDEVTRHQFQAFREDISTSILEDTPSVFLSKLVDSQVDAFVLPTEVLDNMDLNGDDFTIISFNPKELIPAPGSGVIAYVTAEDDIHTRRILKKIHHPKVTAVANVERRLKQLFNDEKIAAYCEIDRAFNYHFLAATVINGALKKIRLSQSTSFELAEKCYEGLK